MSHFTQASENTQYLDRDHWKEILIQLWCHEKSILSEFFFSQGQCQKRLSKPFNGCWVKSFQSGEGRVYQERPARIVSERMIDCLEPYIPGYKQNKNKAYQSIHGSRWESR